MPSEGTLRRCVECPLLTVVDQAEGHGWGTTGACAICPGAASTNGKRHQCDGDPSKEWEHRHPEPDG
ncbi:hypothetical protein GCM10027168_15800 [Streptomyces capparidis]